MTPTPASTPTPAAGAATSAATWQLWLTAAEVIAQAKQQWQQNGVQQQEGRRKAEEGVGGSPTAIVVAIATADVVGQDKFLRFQ